jgi:hypothetical protein
MGERRGVYSVLVGREGDHLGDPGVDGSSGSEIWGYGLELAQDEDRWRALVNAVMNLRVT